MYKSYKIALVFFVLMNFILSANVEAAKGSGGGAGISGTPVILSQTGVCTSSVTGRVLATVTPSPILTKLRGQWRFTIIMNGADSIGQWALTYSRNTEIGPLLTPPYFQIPGWTWGAFPLDTSVLGAYNFAVVATKPGVNCIAKMTVNVQ